MGQVMIYNGERPVAEWTNLEVFDHVYDHLLSQNIRSGEYWYCRYRKGIDNNSVFLACAIGCLLPDRLYNENFEEKIVESLISNETIFAWLGIN